MVAGNEHVSDNTACVVYVTRHVRSTSSSMRRHRVHHTRDGCWHQAHHRQHYEIRVCWKIPAQGRAHLCSSIWCFSFGSHTQTKPDNIRHVVRKEGHLHSESLFVPSISCALTTALTLNRLAAQNLKGLIFLRDDAAGCLGGSGRLCL